MTQSASRMRSPYHPFKRARRCALRLAGRWLRADYDVRIEFRNGAPQSKHVHFASVDQARQVASALEAFAGSPHVPQLQEINAATVSTEFIHGTLCKPMTDKLVPEVGRCLGHINACNGHEIELASSPLWQSHLERLGSLRNNSVIDSNLYARLRELSEARAPSRLRIGFDYTDPIGQNLVYRTDRACVAIIDIKNLRAGQPIGLGAAKAADKWLTPARRRQFFDAYSQVASSQTEHAFDFLRLFEYVQRAARKTEQEIRLRRWFKKTRHRRDGLLRLADALTQADNP